MAAGFGLGAWYGWNWMGGLMAVDWEWDGLYDGGGAVGPMVGCVGGWTICLLLWLYLIFKF